MIGNVHYHIVNYQLDDMSNDNNYETTASELQENLDEIISSIASRELGES